MTVSATHEGNSDPVSKVQRVRQVADTLGISERTVYRRLRSGKLDQLPPESISADNVMTNVNRESIAEQIIAHMRSEVDIFRCQNDMTNDKLTILCQELANRDAQILSLLENQKELTLTIQKLQAQMFELARLALQPPLREEAKPEEAALAVDPRLQASRRGLRGWLRNFTARTRDR